MNKKDLKSGIVGFIPGFRTGTKWKMIIASIYYLFALICLLGGIGLFLFLASIPFVIINLITAIRRKNKMYYIAAAVSFIVLILGCILIPTSDSVQNTISTETATPFAETPTPVPTENITPTIKATTPTPTPNITATPISTPIPTPTPTPELTLTPTVIPTAVPTEEPILTETPHRTGEEIIGISDQNISDISVIFTEELRNDKTGNWRCAVMAENIDLKRYALSYYKQYVKDDKEVHMIINFSKKTTARLNVFGDMIFLTFFDYVNGEEHDVSKMCSGTLLESYIIYKDNGDIEKIPPEEY